jgi:hypothetical protein
MPRLATLFLLLSAATLGGCVPAPAQDDVTAAYLGPDGELLPPDDAKEDSPLFAKLERALINRDDGVVNDVQLSYRSAMKLAVSVGIACGPDAVTITAVARQESTFRVNIVGPVNDNGTVDYGVWQINSGTAVELGFKTSQLKQPQVNAEAMDAVLSAQGLDAWSAYKFGRYKKYVKYAQETLDTYGCE